MPDILMLTRPFDVLLAAAQAAKSLSAFSLDKCGAYRSKLHVDGGVASRAAARWIEYSLLELDIHSNEVSELCYQVFMIFHLTSKFIQVYKALWLWKGYPSYLRRSEMFSLSKPKNSRKHPELCYPQSCQVLRFELVKEMLPLL